MNWEAIGAIGEIVGAVAVVATLSYLARQMTQAGRATSSQVYQDRAGSRISMHMLTADSDHLAPIIHRLEGLGWPENLHAVDELDGLAQYRFKQFMGANIVRLDAIYFQYRKGLLDEDGWNWAKEGIAYMAPTWRKLGVLRFTASQPFKDEVERVLADADHTE